MNIVNTVLGDATGGRWKVVLDYSEQLSRLGHTVYLLVHKNQLSLIDYNQFKYLPHENVYAIANSGHYDPIATVCSWRLLRKFKADMVIAHCSRSVALMQRAVLGKIPVTCVMHSVNPKRCLRADAFINITHFIENKLKEQGAEGKPHYFVPNLLDQCNPVMPAIRDYHDVPVIGAIGRFVSYKGFHIYLEALKILCDKNIVFKAILAGDGPEKAILNRQLEDLGLSEVVEMPGWLPDSGVLFKRIDILCVPSIVEPFGLIFLEAFNHALPIVCTDAEGPSEICQDGENAVLVKKNSAQALGAGLEKLLEDKRLANRLVQGGYDRLMSTYNAEVVAPKLEAAISNIVDDF